MKILIFEDDQSIGDLLKCFLIHKGHDVTVFKDPTSCPLYLNGKCDCPENSPCADVILIDYNMPQLTGLELIHRQERMGCKVQVENKAIMSAYLRPEEFKELAAKGYQIVSKPFEMEKILKFMEECRQRLANTSDATQH